MDFPGRSVLIVAGYETAAAGTPEAGPARAFEEVRQDYSLLINGILGKCVGGQDRRKYLCVPLGPIKTMTKAEAKRNLRSILEKRGINAADYLERVNQANQDVRTFAQEAKWWTENRLSLFKPSTQDKMNSHLEKYLLPRFGMLPVSIIDERQVQQFIAELSRAEYKTPTEPSKGSVHPPFPTSSPC